MAQKKYFQEAQNSPAFSLLALLVDGGGSLRVESKNGQAVLWISPDDLAQKLAPKIKALKRDLILLAGHCPECGGRLTVRVDPQKWSQRQFCAKEGHFSDSRDLPDFPVLDRNGKEI